MKFRELSILPLGLVLLPILPLALQLKTLPMFSSNDQSSTLYSPSAMLQFTCQRHPRRPYCQRQVPRPSFCARLTLQRTSSLTLPQDPSPSCSVLTLGRPSFADHPRAIFSSGDNSTALFWTTSTRFDLRETLSQHPHFLGRIFC